VERLKREASPTIAVIAILATLTVIQVLYWRGLIGGPQPFGGPSARGPAGGPSQEPPPTGRADAIVTTLAGGAEAGYRDGPLAAALFDGPADVAADRAGRVLVADSRNHCVRVITPERVATLAGRPGEPGLADGPAEQARFFAPAGLAVAPDGGVLVADTGNHRIRRIAPDGTVSTYAGAASPRDDLGRELGGLRDGRASEAQFRYPVGVAVDESGTVYVADAGNGRVRMISPEGVVSSLSSQGELAAPTHVTVAPGGRLWVADTGAGALWSGPRQGPLVRAAELGEAGEATAPAGMAAVVRGGRTQVYVADAASHCIWRVGEDGVALVAGQQAPGEPGRVDGPGDRARFSGPAGLAVGLGGALLVADFGGHSVRRVELAEEGR